MEKEMILLTNADLSIGAGDTTLIVRRAEELYKEKAIKTRCYIYKSHKHELPKIKSNAIEFYIAENKKKIKNSIIENKPRYILYYGTKILLLNRFIKKVIKKEKNKVEELIDVQGCLEETVEYNRSIKANVKFLIQKIIFRKALNEMDGCFVVSDELRKYCYKYLKEDKKNKIKFYKVRCGINDVFEPKDLLKMREDMRKKLKIDKDTIVFVYSGFRSAWQNIDKIIEQFKVYDELYDKAFFCFFCNVDEEFEEKIHKEFPKKNYILQFAPKDNYFKYLSACDVGMIYRDTNMTNRVAFPNKFADYLNSGLIIGINDALIEPVNILKKHKLEYLNTNVFPNNDLEKMVLGRKCDILNYYKKTFEICTSEIKYSNQIKNLEI